MKIQKFGIDRWEGYKRMSAISMPAQYVAARENGFPCDNPPCVFPTDGKYTWIKGRTKGKWIYGVKNKKGKYEYELRYDEGPGDNKWMGPMFCPCP